MRIVRRTTLLAYAEEGDDSTRITWSGVGAFHAAVSGATDIAVNYSDQPGLLLALESH